MLHEFPVYDINCGLMSLCFTAVGTLLPFVCDFTDGNQTDSLKDLPKNQRLAALDNELGRVNRMLLRRMQTR